MEAMDSQVENKHKVSQPTLQVWLDRIRPHRIPIALFLLTIVLYANTFGNELLIAWDDFKYINANQFIQNFSPQGLVDIYTNPYYAAYLPVTLTTYWFEFALWGTDPVGYHVVNVIFQAFNGVLVYYFLRRLKGNATIALIASLIFIAHPLQVETVAWVSERKALVSMFFLLLTFLAHMRSADKDAPVKWIIFSWILFALAVASKPITVGAPLLFVFYDYYWGKRTIRQIFERNAVYFGIGIIGAYLILVAHDDYGAIRPTHGGSLFATAYVMLIVVWDYLVSLILPFHLNNFYGYDTNVIIQAFDIRVILGIGVILGMLWIAWKEPLGKGISRFSILWIAVLIAPVSNIVPLSTLRADRYLYFPLVTISLLVAILFMRIWERREQIEFRYAMVVGFAAVIGIFSAITIHRNTIWFSGHTLWSDHLSDYSFSHSGWLNRGYYHWVNGNLAQSEYDFEQLVSQYPNAERGHRYIGLIAEINQDYEKAVIHLKRSLELLPDPDSDNPDDTLGDNLGLSLFQLGLQEFNDGKFELALTHYSEATQYLREEPVLYNNIGFTLEQLERYDEAINFYRQALAFNPAYTRAAVNWLNAAFAITDMDQATQAFEVIVTTTTSEEILTSACQKMDDLGIPDDRCA